MGRSIGYCWKVWAVQKFLKDGSSVRKPCVFRCELDYGRAIERKRVSTNAKIRRTRQCQPEVPHRDDHSGCKRLLGISLYCRRVSRNHLQGPDAALRGCSSNSKLSSLMGRRPVTEERSRIRHTCECDHHASATR